LKQIRKLFVENLLALLLILAGGILVFMHLNINRTLEELSVSLISSTQNRTEAELNHYFETVNHELIKACKMGEMGLFDELEVESLNEVFLPLLWQSHQISSVQIGSSKGNEYMLMHRDSIWINRRIENSGGRNWSYWKGLETGNPQLIERKTDHQNVLPQNKDWFRNALQTPGQSFWSEPYRFQTAQNTGLTISRSFRSRQNPDVDYVIAVDVLLEDLSRFTMELKMSQNDREFVITPEGKMVGIPRDSRGRYRGFFKEYLLRPASELYIEPLTLALDKWQGMSKQTDHIFEYDYKGTNWWAGLRPFQLGEQQTLYMGVIVPETDFLPSVRRTRNIILLGWVLIIALVVVIGFSYRRQKKAQTVLEEKNRLIAEEHRQLAIEQERTEKLQQLDKLKDDFLANTSHELRTPLNGIIGISESLYDELESFPPEELRKNLSMVIASGKRLATLVNDILDFSKLRNHNLILSTRAVDLRSLTNVVLKLIRPLVQGKDLKLLNEISPDLPPVEADEDRLQQILYNLIGNAIKFTEKGQVSINAEHQGEKVLLSVSDTGIGIPKEKQETIFSLFEQADGDIARKYGGTGLGLSITRQLVSAHGGELKLDSAVGMGSRFYFDLPVSQKEVEESLEKLMPRVAFDDAEEDFAVRIPSERFAPEGTIRVLLVDDEPINLQVLINHLSSSSYHVEMATNGQEALDFLDRGHQFDLVLLDVMMPGMSGYEVCERIRERYLPSELPIIMITAKNQVIDLVQGLSFGANDYLAKPFSKNEFLARVKTHLRLANINAAYGRFVPHEFLRALGHESIMEVKVGDQIERIISVLFTDIRSYTTLAEEMTPADNFQFINNYLGRMAPVIKEHRGLVNQFLGDGIIALFPDSPADAIRAAIGMQQEIHRYNVDRVKRGWIPIKVGMGTHTGPLIMGIIGDHERMDAGIIADTVNTAARLEGLTKYFHASLVVSEDTRTLMSNPHEFNQRFLGKVQVKGKKLPVGIYEFFDGDEPALIEKKLQTKQDFEQGLAAYFQREFALAVEAFENVLQPYPEDKVALSYLNQAKRFAREGVPADWTGVETMLYK
jgi:signal transduction histidine kinase/class 3 adenylate cyclase/ActR/RegA family two-component response regulator